MDGPEFQPGTAQKYGGQVGEGVKFETK